MALPNTISPVSPFDIILSETTNEMIENVEALAAGTGLNDGVVTAPKIIGINKSNLTTDSNPYKFRAYRNAPANTGNGAFAVIAHDVEAFDTNNNLASGVYTVPVTGFYQFNWSGFATLSLGVDESFITALFKNGSEVTRGNTITAMGVQGSTGSDLVPCTAADTLDVRAYAPVTRALQVAASSQNVFSGFLVSRT